MSNKIKFIIVEENTIVYFNSRWPVGWAQILKSSILKGGSGAEGVAFYTGSQYRDATLQDFKEFNLNPEPYNKRPNEYEEIK